VTPVRVAELSITVGFVKRYQARAEDPLGLHVFMHLNKFLFITSPALPRIWSHFMLSINVWLLSF